MKVLAASQPESQNSEKKFILISLQNRHDRTCQMAQTDKKLKNPFIQISKKKPEQRYKQSELDIIFESDSEDFLKNNILRILYIIIYKINYVAYFQISVNINGYNIKIIIDSGATGNFILIKIIKIQKIFKRRKISSVEFIIINKIFIFQNNGLIKFEILFIFMKIHQYQKKI